MPTVHESVAKFLAENPQAVSAVDWSKVIQAIEALIPVVLQIITIFKTPTPVPTPTPAPTPAH